MSKLISIQGDVLGSCSALQSTTTNVDTSVGLAPTATGMVLTSLAGNITAGWSALPPFGTGDMVGPGPTTAINNLVTFAGADGVTTIDSGVSLELAAGGIIKVDGVGLTAFTPVNSGVGLGALTNPFDSLILTNTVTAGLGAPNAGRMKYNSSNARMEYADGVSWKSMDAGQRLTVRTETLASTVLTTDDIINMNNTGTVALTLVSAVPNEGKVYTIINTTADVVTLTSDGIEVIVNGGLEATTLTISGLSSRVQVYSNGIKWFVM